MCGFQNNNFFYLLQKQIVDNCQGLSPCPISTMTLRDNKIESPLSRLYLLYLQTEQKNYSFKLIK